MANQSKAPTASAPIAARDGKPCDRSSSGRPMSSRFKNALPQSDARRDPTNQLYARRQIDADASRLQTRLANTNVAIAIQAKMQPVWEKDLAPRPAFVSAK